MDTSGAAKLAEFICSLPNLCGQAAQRSTYGHMGATLSDAILQSGLNYRTVVYPRVRNLIRRFPGATSTATFWTVLEAYTPANVLSWSHPEKLRRLLEVASMFLDCQVQTEADLRTWLMIEKNEELLMSIKGIGPKTRDYMKLLVGIPTVSVDRHIRKFVAMAGLRVNGYEEVKCIFLEAAEILQMEASALDHCIWKYLSKSEEAITVVAVDVK